MSKRGHLTAEHHIAVTQPLSLHLHQVATDQYDRTPTAGDALRARETRADVLHPLQLQGELNVTALWPDQADWHGCQITRPRDIGLRGHQSDRCSPDAGCDTTVQRRLRRRPAK
ncbi:hypothetical protein D3C76_1301820 [compost metagenome]